MDQNGNDMQISDVGSVFLRLEERLLVESTGQAGSKGIKINLIDVSREAFGGCQLVDRCRQLSCLKADSC